MFEMSFIKISTHGVFIKDDREKFIFKRNYIKF